MTILTSADIFATLTSASAVRDSLHDPHKTAFDAAMTFGRSPVDMASDAVEALYAAVLQDTALTGAALTAVATACKQVGFLLVVYGWHGKAQRCADMGVAMEAVVAGTAPSALTGAPAVDSAFAPTPALIPAPTPAG